jgi:hypothetical protein
MGNLMAFRGDLPEGGKCVHTIHAKNLPAMKGPILPPSASGSFLPGRFLALPSWVFPGSLAENCRFLAGRADEAGLLFFAASSSLAYGPEDIPPDLGDLPLRFHVHLPLDLPWKMPAEAARICFALLEKTAFLHPGRAVLHPPPQGRGATKILIAFLENFAARGGSPGIFLLENTRENDLRSLVPPAEDYDLHFCIDMGHILAYGQEKLLGDDALLARTELLQISASGPKGDEHLPLTALDAGGVALARRLFRAAPRQAVIMLELFHWPHVEISLPLIRQWLQTADSL